MNLHFWAATLFSLFLLYGNGHGATITVDTEDGGTGPGTLHAAIVAANASAGVADTIDLRTRRGVITLQQDLPPITDEVTFEGPGALRLAISGGQTRRIFNINSGTSAEIRALTLRDGEGGSAGGAILCSGGLIISDCVLENNRAACAGAVRLEVGAACGIQYSAFVNNRATADSGALESIGGRINLLASTFSGNQCGNRGGAIGIFGSGHLMLDCCTLTDNEAGADGGAIFLASTASTNVEGSILAGNRAGGETTKDVQFDGTVFLNENFIGGDPKLRPLSSCNSPTPYHLPQLGSPVINGRAEAADPIDTDQRNRRRQGTGKADIGAIEVRTIVVTDHADTEMTGTLRGAVAASNSALAAERIDYIDLRAISALSPVNPFALTQGAILVGGGAAKTTISGGPAGASAFTIDAGACVGIEGITIRDFGQLHRFSGVRNEGALAVRDCVFERNVGEQGGAILSTGSLKVDRSTFVENETFTGSGGALHVTGEFEISNSTFYRNDVSVPQEDGGAIYLAAGSGNVSHCTFYRNAANDRGGAIGISGGSMDIANSLFADNSALTGDHIDNSGGTVSKTGTLEISHPSALVLDFHGGPTPVLALTPDSPAINAADPAAILPSDQLGHYRPLNGLPDAGAVEYFGDDVLGSWRARYFTEAELCNYGLEFSRWGNRADPDCDGRNNLAEAMAGTHPLVPDQAVGPEFLVSSFGGSPKPAVRFEASTQMYDFIGLDVTGSTDLAKWSAAGISEITASVDGTTTAILGTGTASTYPTGRYFLRLEIPTERIPLVTLPCVAVGNPGNTAETESGFGAVGYNYMIGKFEVTVGQWVAFLNAVDPNGSNSLGLYVAGGNVNFSGFGLPGHRYSAAIFTELLPIGSTNFYDAVRFCNWLHHGALPGGDTESGAYTLLGGTPIPSNAETISRNAGARYALPTIDEWFKAGHFVSEMPLTYSDYPHGQNTVNNDPAPGDNASANYRRSGLLPVGSYPSAVSPWGCHNMTGNVTELLDSVPGSPPGAFALGASYESGGPLVGLSAGGAEERGVATGFRIVRLR